ncbi:MAG: phosphatidate cytidylyltransferase [Candidatus Dactylopiibacterium sp.]|nr:phosphatidate cytidylyltransferase [Candidatus Dactylopiibacterium sp.]
MLKQRVITALILGFVVILSIFLLPDPLWGVLIGAIVAFAVHEWCALVKIGRVGQGVLSALCVLPVLYVAIMPPGAIEDLPFLLGALYVVCLSFWLFSVPTFLYFRIEPVGWYWRFFAPVLMFVAAGMALLELRRASPWLVLAAILLVSIADIAAYFTGRAFGRRKLAPQISPGKTWEGVAGAVVAVLVFCALLWQFVPVVQATVGIATVLVFAIVAVALSVMGDLYESLLKREAGVKDSGSVLPGHGGVLDRIDAMLAFLPFAGAALLFLQMLN